VNGFKRINDSNGHAASDQVIAQLARRLVPLAREGRLLARIGGDEFVVLLSGPDAGSQAVEAAREVQEAMAEPFDVLATSCGLARRWDMRCRPPTT
jgi:diguanylate cyclase (GGDEF)-like protein